MKRYTHNLVMLLIICIIFKMLVVFVTFVHESTRGVGTSDEVVCRTEFGHRCGCIYVYEGQGRYKLKGTDCPKEGTNE